MANFTTTDGCQLYYSEYGAGEPLIFIHGWSANSTFFGQQIAYFAQKYRVIAYDLRGHGQSDRGEVTEQNMTLDRYADDLRELIEGLGLDKVNVVGWSMGTSILFAYVRKYGTEYLNKICLVDMTPKSLTDDEWKLGSYGAFTHEDNLKFLALIAKDWDAAIAQFTPTCFPRGTALDSPVYLWTVGEMKKNTPHVLAYMWIAMSSEDFRPVLKDITIPTLLTFGADGVLHSQAHGEYLEQNIANSKLVMFPGCGHAPFAQDAAKFNAELEAFLA
jgi:pimeloyl-ACP methyl ester carboxylesterase